MNRVSISEIEPEEYEPVTIPVKDIKRMIKTNTWEDSFEQEEVIYNLENNLYLEDYIKEVKEFLYKYEGEEQKNIKKSFKDVVADGFFILSVVNENVDKLF